jgi:hypothetical protein
MTFTKQDGAIVPTQEATTIKPVSSGQATAQIPSTSPRIFLFHNLSVSSHIHKHQVEDGGEVAVCLTQ